MHYLHLVLETLTPFQKSLALFAFFSVTILSFVIVALICVGIK